MYRFPYQKVTKDAVVFLYFHSLGTRKAIDMLESGRQVYRFSWGLANNVGVFNQDGDYLHIAEVNAIKVLVVEGK